MFINLCLDVKISSVVVTPLISLLLYLASFSYSVIGKFLVKT